MMQLVNGGDYRVIERSQLDKIMAEQNLSNSDRADPATAAKIGGVLGVDAIIIGDITTTSATTTNTSASGGGGGTVVGQRRLRRFGMDTHKAVVEITARVVDVNTARFSLRRPDTAKHRGKALPWPAAVPPAGGTGRRRQSHVTSAARTSSRRLSGRLQRCGHRTCDQSR